MKILFKFILILILCLVDVKAADVIVWREDSNSILLDRYTLQKIFTQRITKWPTGQQIQVFIKPMNSVEHRDFVTNVLGLSLFTYQQLLSDGKYKYHQMSKNNQSGLLEVTDDKMMIQKIEKTPGSIGYINYKIIVCSKDVIIIDSNEVK